MLDFESRNAFGIKASESAVMFADDSVMLADRKQFVENLGWLLNQTREGIRGCFLDEDGYAHVVFRQGGEQVVNVRGDSYMAIIRDVAKALR